jgi:hypothetical protein
MKELQTSLKLDADYATWAVWALGKIEKNLVAFPVCETFTFRP